MTALTDQQILEKAIQKAIDGGWKPAHPVYDDHYKGDWYSLMNDTPKEIVRYFDPEEYESVGYECLIFNHDFAKALWGEWQQTVVTLSPGKTELVGAKGWKYHLSEMVIADDPIQYLGDNL